MKISILTSIYPQKGISVYSDHLINGLIDKNLKIEVIGFKNMYPNFLYPDGANDPNILTPSFSTKHVSIKKIINWYNPYSWIKAGFSVSGDIFHVQWWTYTLFPIYSTILLIAKLIKRKKTIVTFHNVISHENRFLSKLLNHIIIRLGDYFVVHNLQNKNELKKLFNIKKNKIFIIPIGIYNNPKYKKISTAKAKQKIKINPTTINLLFLGHIRNYKGLDVLLKAMPSIIKNNSKINLTIAGTCWGNWNKYKTIIKKYKLNNYLNITSRYLSNQEINIHLSASDLVILPYKKFDSSSGLIKTILYYEKPIVVTNVGDLPEIVPNYRFIVKANDVDDLAQKIIYLINHPKELKDTISYFKKIKKLYSWKSISKKYYDLYKEINTTGFSNNTNT